MFNLLHQFFTSLTARVLYPQAIRRPLMSCLRNPKGHQNPLSLFWPELVSESLRRAG